MSEEEVAEVSEPQGGDIFDMEGAVESIGDDLFDKEVTDDSEDTELSAESEQNAETVEESGEEKTVEKSIEEKSTENVEEEIKKEIERIGLPTSWKKEMQERWEKFDESDQQYIVQREEEMRNGLEKDRGDANLGRTMRDMMSPFDSMLKERGLEASQVVKHMLQNHQQLSSGTPEQRTAALRNFAKSYGIDTRNEVPQNEQYTGLNDRLQNIEQNLNASQERSQQEAKTRINTEVTAFADEHPLFDELSDEISSFIRVGDSLEDAYEKALWANPVTRQKELDRQADEKAKEDEKRVKAEAAEAKKAKSVNVKGRDTNKTPQGKPGKMFDDMNDIYKDIKSRN